jgi:hypothetical protein
MSRKLNIVDILSRRGFSEEYIRGFKAGYRHFQHKIDNKRNKSPIPAGC